MVIEQIEKAASEERLLGTEPTPEADLLTARSSPLYFLSFLLLDGASVVLLLQCIWSPCDEPVDSCALSDSAAGLHASSVRELVRQPAWPLFFPVDCIHSDKSGGMHIAASPRSHAIRLSSKAKPTADNTADTHHFTLCQ